MNIQVVAGNIAQTEAPAIVVNLFEGVTSPSGATGAVDQALGGGISGLIADGEIKGKLGEVTTIHTLGRIPAKRVLVAGLGKSDDFTTERVRRVSADVVRAAKKAGIKQLSTIVHGAGIGGLDPAECAQALVEGALLGGYSFTRRKSSANENGGVESVSIVENDASKVAALEAAVQRGLILGGATIWARDVANEPGNHMTPTVLAEEAARVAEAHGLEIEVLEKHQMASLGMNAILAVAAGSAQPPKLIILRYKGDPDSDQAIGLVGKGITFDSGGISIKPAQNMDYMKGDMGGAAAVIAAMGAIAQLKPKINVTALCPCTENLPSGTAYKPGDVIKAYNGKTIEVINTDAEGRVVLSDAVAFATEIGLSPIIDIATLTGAIGVTLGDVCAGIMGTNQQLIDEIMFAGQRAGERFWQLPMYPEYEELIKGATGDWLNSGGRDAGSITGAFFIRQFTDDRPWAHLDIAGVDWSSKEKGTTNKGCTGWGARALVNYVLARAGAI